jgi:hypothetical protein
VDWNLKKRLCSKRLRPVTSNVNVQSGIFLWEEEYQSLALATEFGRSFALLHALAMPGVMRITKLDLLCISQRSTNPPP